MAKFEIVGFKHVKPEGVASLCCRMESEGTVSMLWDMTNKSVVDTIMGEKDWCMQNYLDSIGAIDSDDNAIELHDELVDAKFGLMFAFCNDLDEVTMSTGRIIRGIKEVTVSDCWNPTSYYPRAEIIQFKNWEQLGDFCAEHLGADLDEITVRVTASGDGMSDQNFEYVISGAQEYNCLGEFEVSMREHDYTEFTYTRIN